MKVKLQGSFYVAKWIDDAKNGVFIQSFPVSLFFFICFSSLI